MKLNKIAKEKFTKYMEYELKPGHNKFPSALCHLAQTTYGTTGLLVGCHLWLAACAGSRVLLQAAAVILS